MTFDDIFFMVVIPVAAAVVTGLLVNFIWKSRASSMVRKFNRMFDEQEQRMSQMASGAEIEDDLSKTRERLLYQWQPDLLIVLEPLTKALGKPEALPVDHKYAILEETERELLDEMEERLNALERARVRLMPEVVFAAGYFMHKAKLLAKAEAYYQKARQLDSTAFRPRMNLARLFQREKKYKEASAVFEELRTLRSNDSEVYYGLGICLARQGREEEGIDALVAAIRLNPENPAVYTELANAYARTGDLARGMESLQVALKLKPRFYEARLLQQDLLIRSGDFEDAVRECEKFLNQKQDGVVYFNLARAHVLAGELETGLSALRNAIQIDDSLRFKAKDERAFRDLAENKRFTELLEGRLGLF